MKMKPSNATPQQQSATSIVWPELKLPDPDAKVGMTGAHQDAIKAWCSGVQTELSGRFESMAKEIETLKSKLNSQPK